MSEWNKVEDELPNKSEYYLVAYGLDGRIYGLSDTRIDVCLFQHKVKKWKGTYSPAVKYWKELPIHPEKC